MRPSCDLCALGFAPFRAEGIMWHQVNGRDAFRCTAIGPPTLPAPPATPLEALYAEAARLEALESELRCAAEELTGEPGDKLVLEADMAHHLAESFRATADDLRRRSQDDENLRHWLDPNRGQA